MRNMSGIFTGKRHDKDRGGPAEAVLGHNLDELELSALQG
jgi:hypothetical protein